MIICGSRNLILRVGLSNPQTLSISLIKFRSEILFFYLAIQCLPKAQERFRFFKPPRLEMASNSPVFSGVNSKAPNNVKFILFLLRCSYFWISLPLEWARLRSSNFDMPSNTSGDRILSLALNDKSSFFKFFVWLKNPLGIVSTEEWSKPKCSRFTRPSRVRLVNGSMFIPDTSRILSIFMFWNVLSPRPRKAQIPTSRHW